MAPKVLVTETLAQAGIELLRQSCDVDTHSGLSAEALAEAVGDYDALIVRSATSVTADLLGAARRLKVVARAGSGVDNIDVEAATRRGVLVVNAPTANTIAVAEHTIALMLALARNIPAANASVHAGEWRRNRFLGSEVQGKTLGLVGLGNVGSAVAARARAFEMHMIAYDPYVSAERAGPLDVRLVGLDELLASADYVSLHAPASAGTRRLIGARELALMRPGSYLVNCARGEIIDEQAVVDALVSGHLAGVALDVYEDEPHVSEALRCCANALLTPHLGASTQEAQDAAALQVARQVADVLAGRAPRYPVNARRLSDEEQTLLAPYLDLAERLGRFASQLAQAGPPALEVSYGGEVAELETGLITDIVLTALLQEGSETPVNTVNARLVAQERGIEVREVQGADPDGFAHLIGLHADIDTDTPTPVAGTVMRGCPHIVRVGEHWFDFEAQGRLLVTEHLEQLGVIGRMGTLLGDMGVSISFVQVGRHARGGRGLMITGLDDPLPLDGLSRLMQVPGIRWARVVEL